MRWLADYAMHGRRQAIIVVLLCGLFPMLYIVSAAMVGLVNLRKEASEGLIILLWSLLPAGLLWTLGDPTPVVLMLSVTALSQVLKRYDSWQLVIMLSAALGIFIQISLSWQTDYVEQVTSIVTDAIAFQQSQGEELPYTAEQLIELLLSFYGAYHMTTIILCLMLARWWQAAMYNPGGFQQEFHQLRFAPKLMLLVLGFILAGMMAMSPFDLWLAIFCIPPTFGGIALMHWIVAKKKMSPVWLVMGYMAVFMMAPAIIILGMLDSVLDLRKRIKV